VVGRPGPIEAPGYGSGVPRERFAIAGDGTPLGYREEGEGDAVLLVHSTAADARQWSLLVPLLARTFRVASMDRRGRGASGPYPADHSLEVEYGDIAAVATSLEGPVHLVGHSSGARFALHAAALIPNLATLILYEPPAPEGLTEPVMRTLAEYGASGDRHGVLRTFFVDGVGMAEDGFDLLQQRPVWPLMMDNALTVPAELSAVRHYRFDPSGIGGLGVPTLLLLGEESDDSVAGVTESIAAALPAATVEILPGQGHGAMFSAPELLATRISSFIAAPRR